MIIYLKRLKSSKFVRVKAFPMYGGIGVSAPSLHRESTDSLIIHVMVNVMSGRAGVHSCTILQYSSHGTNIIMRSDTQGSHQKK